MSARPHILLIDDEASIREPLRRYLERQGFRVVAAESAAAGRGMLAAYAIDCVLLDIMMPGEDGLALTRYLRTAEAPGGGAIPLILLTARSEEQDRVVGLELGADDYVVKPFAPRELVARIRTLLRRAATDPAAARDTGAAHFAFAGWTLRPREQTLHDPDGTLVPLSSGEFALLHALVLRPGQVLTRDQLLDLTKGREAGPFDRAIDNQVSRLRKKIEADPKLPRLIKTVWGGGYKLAAEVTAQ
jgi:two-component system OmpR family response regulator